MMVTSGLVIDELAIATSTKDLLGDSRLSAFHELYLWTSRSRSSQSVHLSLNYLLLLIVNYFSLLYKTQRATAV